MPKLCSNRSTSFGGHSLSTKLSVTSKFLPGRPSHSRPNDTFVLVGGIYTDAAEVVPADASVIQDLPNLLLAGQQPYESMPQYLYHFDVCIIPFKVNHTTHATDPVKMYEYLSAGKPVV